IRHPNELADILRQAVDAYFVAHRELGGTLWARVARILSARIPAVYTAALISPNADRAHMPDSIALCMSLDVATANELPRVLQTAVAAYRLSAAVSVSLFDRDTWNRLADQLEFAQQRIKFELTK